MLDRVVLEVSGTLLVLFTVREIFHDIFHPTRSGSLSDFVGRIASLFMRHTRLRSSVGPLALVAVMLCWVVLLAIGFALLYTGLYPQEFISSAGEVSHGFWMKFLRSLYFSLGSLGAFQTFDLNPRTAWLRLIVAIEGLVGISMITASVSWLVLLYPALARTRMLARRLFVLIEAEKMTSLSLVRELGVPRSVRNRSGRRTAPFGFDSVSHPAQFLSSR